MITLDGTLGITTPNENTPNNFAFKNLLIDAGFTINQRGYVSAATLASGSYGHDRWKAGASGGDYSFTQNASSTTITIASGKSLIQVVEDKNVNGTSFVLSWTGTAQARYAVNSATPAGAYAASPILITGQTQGTTMSVEFNAGTLTTPQLEKGSTATSFDYRPYGTELSLCQRYYNKTTGTIGVEGAAIAGVSIAYCQQYVFPSTMRTAPTCTSAGFTDASNMNGNSIVDLTPGSVSLRGNTYSGIATSPQKATGFWVAGIQFNAEL